MSLLIMIILLEIVQGFIIQFMYGEDAIDSIKIESQSLLIMNKDTDKICKMFLLLKTIIGVNT